MTDIVQEARAWLEKPKSGVIVNASLCAEVERLRASLHDADAKLREMVGHSIEQEQRACAAEAEVERLRSLIEFIGTADSGGELFPVGPSDVEFAADENTVVRYVGPWRFLHGTGDTFLAAVEDAMRRRAGVPDATGDGTVLDRA